MKFSSLTVGLTATFLALAGCGLINPDITKITFDLPTETYTFDTAQWNIPPVLQGTTFPSIACTTDNDCCTLGSAAGIDCATTMLACMSGTCSAELPESQATPINLSTDVMPSLSSYTSLVDISISSINYTVRSNSLNVAVPPLSIYLAPNGVTSPSDPSAQLFGTVPSIAAGATPTGSVQLVTNSAAIFQAFTKNVATPFEIITATTVVIGAGMPVPTGAITIAVTGALSAQP
ncbi:MAG TPA: hypothetical protein VI456_07480 [Polyangia bacterium]